VLKEGKPVRTLLVKVDHPYAEPVDATIEIPSLKPVPIRLTPGTQSVAVQLPSSDRGVAIEATIRVAGQAVVQKKIALKPVRHWTIYLLSHSHVDIGYTNVQTEIEKLHWKFTDEALEICRKTADYPAGAKFKWNSEVLWAVDSYLKQATPEKRTQFAAAVRSGQVHLDALYGNELTGLCRPEELFRLTDCARRMERRFGVPIDAAMISDVPGYTWGIVPALAQSGVRYFSVGSNHVHRIGRTIEEWGDKPFYWVSPSGQERILIWVAGKGYSWFHLNGRIKGVKPEKFFEYLGQLEEAGFPYDLLKLRYSIDGDNGPPDPELPDYVKRWNETYVWPKMAIGTTREVMQELERRYGDKIPTARGDFTPYWEDGAGSSARETALARNASERLVQAETLFALRDPAKFPVEGFYQAWRKVLLYNEHTWGAHCSISQPESDFTKAQWKIKQSFALEGNAQSQKLLADATGKGQPASTVAAIDVWNTCSWPRTDLVVLPREMKVSGDAVADAEGRAVPSQRLTTGELAFLASDVPSLGAKRFAFRAGQAAASGKAVAKEAGLSNDRVCLAVVGLSGGLTGLTAKSWPDYPLQRIGTPGLDDYFYVAGRDLKKVSSSGPATVRAKERGPLVASLVVESAAPGCKKLVREVRVIDGLERVDLINTLDRELVRTPESVHFGFSPNVPEGTMRMDIPWGVIRPEQDQLPGACKNYFSVGRWVDVSNDRFGLACATLDAPLAEVGAVTVDVPSPFDPKVWIKTLQPTQTFYSYAMNNYWETNYKAEQPGETVFRYSLMPHGPFDPVAVARFGIERSQPLVVAAADPKAAPAPSRLRVEPQSVMVTSLKPAEDGKGLVLRLHNVGSQPADARLTWNDPKPGRLVLSSPKENIGDAAGTTIRIAPSGIVTVRTVE
jgi:hypothetical protein